MTKIGFYKNVYGRALSDLKNKNVIKFSLMYNIIAGLIMCFKYSAERADFNKKWGLPNDITKFVITNLLDFVMIILLMSFVYMLLNKKFKVKRFLSFFHIKHIGYNIPFLLLFVLLYNISNDCFNLFKNQENKIPGFIFAFLVIIILEVRELSLCFRAVYVHDNFIAIVKKSFNYFIHNLDKMAVLCFGGSFIAVLLTFAVYSLVRYVPMSSSVEYIFKSMNYGVNIFYLPFVYFSIYYYITDVS